jgi:asparagine synthase (glutamine-hydrolysing)
VLNGEIYNHLEVRREIGSQAGEWLSTSDTETLLKAWTLWGPECLRRLRGMFAFAFWDNRRRALWCARDRLGIKPLYYYAADKQVVFASEVRSVLASGLVAKRLDRVGLSQFIRFGSVVEPYTLIEGLRSLPAGTYWEVTANNSEPVRYWAPPTALRRATRQEAAVAVREHLERSVREHLLADVPVGCFLSGGIDSSIITALAARNSSLPVRTFTVTFPNASMDESRFANTIAERYSTEHYPIKLTTDEVVRMVPEAVAAMDLPSADAINTYIVSRATTSTGTKVALSGLGGDELFGGYSTFKSLARANRFGSILSPFAAPLSAALRLRGGAKQRFEELLRPGRTLAERHESVRSYWSLREFDGMNVGAPLGYGDNAEFSGLDVATRVSLLELQGYMRSTLLRDGDCMSMASSLEVRFPFLDHLLVECAIRSSAAAYALKTRPKDILLLACEDLLPSEVVNRPKQGFDLPMTDWMNGPLRDFTETGLKALAVRRVLPSVDLNRLKREFEARRLSWARLWQFVVLGHWLEQQGVVCGSEGMGERQPAASVA